MHGDKTNQMMNISEAERLVESAWERVKSSFRENNPSERVHSWEQSSEASLQGLEEYFWGSSWRFAMLLSNVSRYLEPGAKVLDAGAGHGVLAAAFKDAGYEAYASDIHQGIRLFEVEEIPYKPWHLEGEAAPYDDNFFDAVILSQTIEHFTYSPLHPLTELLRILKPGGILIVDAPNIACFHNVSRLLRGKSLHWQLKKHYLEQQPEMYNGIPYYDRHNHEYSMEDMRDIADFFGLDVLEAKYYSSYNRKKRGSLAIAVSRVRDALPKWRKAICAIYRKPSTPNT